MTVGDLRRYLERAGVTDDVPVFQKMADTDKSRPEAQVRWWRLKGIDWTLVRLDAPALGTAPVTVSPDGEPMAPIPTQAFVVLP